MFKPTNIANECRECKGKCWVANSQSATQKNAREMFGILPNPCINGAGNAVRCPVALGIL